MILWWGEREKVMARQVAKVLELNLMPKKYQKREKEALHNGRHQSIVVKSY